MTEHHVGSLELLGEGNGPAGPVDEAERFRDEPEPDLGRHAYDAYCAATGGVSLVTGAQLPAYDALPADIRAAWQMSATAVARVILD